jgi:hypothetical protein
VSFTAPTEDEIAARVAYVREFESALFEAAARALSEDVIMAGVQVMALYSPQERVQAAWAGAELDMPIEETVGLFLILGAVAEADKARGRSLLARLKGKRSESGRCHAAFAAYAREVLLAGWEPSSHNIFERFTSRSTGLLSQF